MDRKSTSPGEFAQHCERVHREWHDRAKVRDTEGLLALYATEAVLESPLVPAILDGKSDGVLRGHAELRHFFSEGAARRPNELVRWHRTGEWLTDGRRMLIWEYPRAAPDGDQVDLAEVMEIADGLIQYHRIYWGWKGANLIAPALVRAADAATARLEDPDGTKPSIAARVIENHKLPIGGDTALHCLVAGSGPRPILLLHGFGFTSQVWRRVLAFVLDDATVYAPDLRGYGRSPAGTRGTAFADQEQDLIELLDALGLERAVLAGHSLSGMMLQGFAAHHPDRIAGLVLSNCPARTRPSPPEFRAIVDALVPGFGSPVENRAVLAGFLPGCFDAANLEEGELDRFVAEGSTAPAALLRQALTEVGNYDEVAADALAALRVPALVVHAARDQFVGFEHAVALSDALPESRLLAIERCGHTTIWERPKRWAEEVFAFAQTIQKL